MGAMASPELEGDWQVLLAAIQAGLVVAGMDCKLVECLHQTEAVELRMGTADRDSAKTLAEERMEEQLRMELVVERKVRQE